MKLEADAWTAAFFAPLIEMRSPVPTSGEVKKFGSQEFLDDSMAKLVKEIAEKYRFFHWFLEFPDVFAAGGFDVILGNPPWDVRESDEDEFFAEKCPEIAHQQGNKRKMAIQALAKENSFLYGSWIQQKRAFESEIKFLRQSKKYPYLSGKVNLYGVFSQLACQLINDEGRVGVVIPTGIATDDSHKHFFSDLVERNTIISLYDFENKEGLFRGTHRSYKFCLITIAGCHTPRSEFAFCLHNINDLRDKTRQFILTKDDINLVNPNTGTCPIFRSHIDAELTRKIYQSVAILINERTNLNPWGVSFRQGLFNMTSDSKLFRTSEELCSEGFLLDGNQFEKGEEHYLPLYEGRMIDYYDHRCATIGISNKALFRSGITLESSLSEHINPNFVAQPRYWINKINLQDQIKNNGISRNWFLGFKDVTSPTNKRTAIFSLIPQVGVGHTLPLVLIEKANSIYIAAFLANMSTFILDYIVRQKLGGIHLTYNYLRQVPVLLPITYNNLKDILVPFILELTYTAWDIKAFADDLWREADEPLRAAFKRQWD